jgi:dethiobiotin synthetase
MALKIFITGTDTNVGKTFISVRLLKALSRQGLKTIGLKPVASGGVQKSGYFYNEDALALQRAASIKLKYADINPFFFTEAVAPHIMAQKVGTRLDVDTIYKKLQVAFTKDADIFIIEGAGGWHLPLNENETMSEVVKKTNLKVVLVVGLRIGCLNHAILTYKAIQQARVPMVGWIANCIDPQMQKVEENMQTLRNFLKIPYLGIINYGDSSETIDINSMLMAL